MFAWLKSKFLRLWYLVPYNRRGLYTVHYWYEYIDGVAVLKETTQSRFDGKHKGICHMTVAGDPMVNCENWKG
jgi:hypothetical protein